ncbi:hypothetical protein JZ751_015187 [Albula glossodonta]|uniref:Fas-binding factor 1 n=1 Tax=Albula glossodonta TaxID=121402 RepID=A0A8T2NV31_9TELE|nr:hypothetical protein JZ751_015187 [Albula glossodonta]
MLPARISERRSGQLPHHGKRSILDDDFFSKLAEEADKEEEDADNMDADLFGSKKMVGNIPAPAGTSSGDREPKPKLQQEQKRQEMVSPERVLKRDELIFNDEEDDLMDALGFGESPKRKAAMSVGERDSEPALPLQSRLDDVVSRGSSLHPPAEEKDNLVEQKLITKEDDFIFGSYQPTLATSLEGRQSRRPSVRFSTEDVNSLLPERKRSSATTASPSACPSRPAADWLGLKQEELELKPEQVSLAANRKSPVFE